MSAARARWLGWALGAAWGWTTASAFAAAPSSGATTPAAPASEPAALDQSLSVPQLRPPLLTLHSPGQRAGTLLLDEVLDSVEARYPLLLAEAQGLQSAEADALAAAGSFDPKWKTKASAFPMGYYRYFAVESVIEQPLYWRGLSAFAGYRLGQGKFPVYYDAYRTNSLGEARVGVTAPLLRGGSIDEERGKLWKARAGIEAARQGLAVDKLEFLRAASYKYWEWVAAGRKLAIARALLDSALERTAAIDARVAQGDAAAIERLDNARAIVQREQQVVAAERTLTSTRLALSLYLRSDDGEPVVPASERLPEQFPEPIELTVSALESAVSSALSQRPELREYEAKRQQYQVERDIARNSALPGLDLLVAGSKQFGEGYPEKQPAVLEAGVLLDIPLRTRKQDGRARAAEARFTQYDLQLRYAKEKIVNEVRDAAAGADATAQRVALARRELLLAHQLERAERQRFDMGDSTMLFVNLREQASFDAANREIDTLLEHHKAHALYRTVTGRR